MVGDGIHDGDLLVVDRSLTPAPGRVVIAALDGELTVKRLGRGPDGCAWKRRMTPTPSSRSGKRPMLESGAW